MDGEERSVFITTYEYKILKRNYLISTICKQELEIVQVNDEEVELKMSLDGLKELIGYVAAEANHARSKRQGEDLNSICDYLEMIEQVIKRQQ